MKKNINIAIIIFLLGAGSIYSQSYYMNVWSGGNVTSVSLSDVSRITFADLTSSIETDKAAGVIKNFELFQNYPNPFNPSTTIGYQVPGAGDVEIKIFSINGELVKSMRSEHAGAGQYSIIWDGKNDAGTSVTSGMYIYRVSYGSSMIAKKMLLIK